jgi:nicotinamide-nucleotide amidase
MRRIRKLENKWNMELFNKKILEAIGKKLIQKKQSVSLAESVTSGLLQLAFSAIPDATQFFQGGMTAYNLGQKFKHLHVEPIHALSVNCVSQQVANEMAFHICELYSSDWGIGVTGYASPVPESGNKIFAFYSITYKNKLKEKGKITAKKDIPIQMQLKYANFILHKFAQLL